MKHLTFWALTFACATTALPLAAVSADSSPQQVQRSRCLAVIGGCDECVLHKFEQADLRAPHAFVCSPGPAGRLLPAYRAPGLAAAGPANVFPALGTKGQP